MRRLAPFAAAAVAVAVVCTAIVGTGTVLTSGERPASDRSTTPSTTTTATPAPSASGPRVAPLPRVVVPDLLVVTRRAPDRKAVKAVRELPGVRELTRTAAGTVRIHGDRLSLLGVNPSTFRSWTPPPTAESDAMWRALASDQLVLSFHARRANRLHLGRSYDIVGNRVLSLRVGAVAELGLPQVDGLVTTTSAGGLGLTDGAGMLVNAPSAHIKKLARAVRRVLGPHARVRTLRAPAAPANEAEAPQGRARTYKELYQQAATRCPGLSWTVLAAIGQVESGHGRNLGPSSAGALGPMQFLPSTWRRWGIDGDGDGREDINDPYDAVPAAADYLCHYGAGRGRGGLADAIFAYNHSDTYVQTVLALAREYS